MRNIVLFPDKALRIKTEKVGYLSDGLLKGIEEVKEVLAVSENGAGLAATQLAINQRFFGIKDAKTKEVSVYINPQITGVYGKSEYPVLVGKDHKEEDFLEGCLSFPNYYGTVKRFLKIEAKWQIIKNGQLKDKKGTLSGFEAIVFQHELDHLNGVVFVDRIQDEGGKFYKIVNEKLEKWDVDEVIKGKLL